MTHPLFEIVTTSAGAISIRNKALGEIMHNPVGPWAEANALYIEQSNLRARLLESKQDELVVFDVGLGAAANSLATLHCARSVAGESRKLHLISFERDMDLLRFALDNASAFAHFAGWEAVLEDLLARGEWSDSTIRWELRRGDFLSTIELETARPHLIFYDPYSQKVNREMWTRATFQKLYRKCRQDSADATSLFTYSQATPVRVGLLQAGFFVGLGRPTGLKEETTIASTTLNALESPLGAVWLKRWQSSHTKTAYDGVGESPGELQEFVLGHPQFRSGQ